MPLFYFTCSKCFRETRKILNASEADKERYCPHCGYAMYRTPTGPSSQAKEILDNGLMPRAVERIANAEELFRERAKEVKETREKK